MGATTRTSTPQVSDPSVVILLWAHNGARHLDAQLASIREQDWQNWSISVRDDGSTDTTIALLDHWASRIPLVVTRGTHIGATASFFELLYHSRECDDEIVAFADQDDV